MSFVPVQVLLHKLDLDHRATKRLCIRGLHALVVDSMPNILRMTEVSGIEKVSPLLAQCLGSLLLIGA